MRGSPNGVARILLTAVLVGGVIHFARPLALSGQDAGSIQVRAVVVDRGAVQETQRAVEALLAEAVLAETLRAEPRQADAPAFPVPNSRPSFGRAASPVSLRVSPRAGPHASTRVEDGPVVALLTREGDRVVITVGDLSH